MHSLLGVLSAIVDCNWCFFVFWSIWKRIIKYFYLDSGWQPLARMGATVTAIDAVDKNIKIASIHAVHAFRSCKLQVNVSMFICLESYFGILSAIICIYVSVFPQSMILGSCVLRHLIRKLLPLSITAQQLVCLSLSLNLLMLNSILFEGTPLYSSNSIYLLHFF